MPLVRIDLMRGKPAEYHWVNLRLSRMADRHAAVVGSIGDLAADASIIWGSLSA